MGGEKENLKTGIRVLKRKAALVLIVGLAVFFVSQSLVSGIDPPHNEASGISCSDCHGVSLLNYQSPFWTDNTADTVYNSLCTRCHLVDNLQPFHASNAPQANTHSPGGTNILCSTCHHNHDQDQIYTGKNNRSDFFLAEGTAISAVYDSGSGTTTITYTSLEATDINSDWAADLSLLAEKTDSGRGSLLIPDTSTRKRWPLYIIVTIDELAPNTILVKGNATAASNIAIMYGQLIRVE
jgi:glycosidase